MPKNEDIEIKVHIDIPASVGAIKSDLNNLNKQLEDNKIYAKVIAGLDIGKTRDLIKNQIDSLFNGSGIPKIQLDIGVNDNAVSQIAQIKNNINNTLNGIEKFDIGTVSTEEIEKFTNRLKELGMSDEYVKNVEKRLSELNFTVSNVTSSFTGLNDGAKVLSSLNITGFDELGNTVKYIEVFDKKTGDLKNATTTVTQNLVELENTGSISYKRLSNNAEKYKKELDGLESKVIKSGFTLEGLGVDENGLSYIERFNRAINTIDSENINEARQALDLMKLSFKNLNSKMDADSPQNAIEKLNKELILAPDRISTLGIKLDKLNNPSEELTTSFSGLRESLNSIEKIDLDNSLSDNEKITRKIEAWEKLSLEISKVNSKIKLQSDTERSELSNVQLIKNRENLYQQIEVYMRNNTLAAEKYGKELRKLQQRSQKAATAADWKQVSKDFGVLKTQIQAAGMNIDTFGVKLKKAITKFGSWMSVTSLISSGVRTIKDMVTNVVELDNALVEFSKVSVLTAEELEKVTTQSFELGETLGKTGKQVIDAVTSFKRAGYELSESMDLAEEALKMTNIAEGIDDTSVAAQSLIAIIKGFRQDSSYASTINDAINQVSNTQAVDFDNLVDGAQTLSAVANQAQVSFEEMLGILTGGYEILGDMSKVANGAITIFSRLQAIQLDGEEEVETVAKLQESFSSATKGAVNIVDQTTGQLNSSYDILDDLAGIWDDLDVNTQSALATSAAGKIMPEYTVTYIKMVAISVKR